MNKLTRTASGALAALTCVALTVDIGAQGRTGRSGAPGPQPQGRSGVPATPPTAVNIADDPLSGPVVTNAPFSADAVTTVTQVLSDGTRIEQTTTARFYRDSAGRVRSEQTVLGLGALDPSSQPRTTISVMTEPDNRATYTLDPVNKTARRGAAVRAYFALSASSGTVSVGATPAAADTVAAIDAENRNRERRAVTVQNGVVAVQGSLAAVRVTGDVEYRLTNIVRAEPSADHFTIPSDYTVLGDTLNAVPAVRTGGPGAGTGIGGGGGRGARQGGTPAN